MLKVWWMQIWWGGIGSYASFVFIATTAAYFHVVIQWIGDDDVITIIRFK